jgi:serpin B
MIVLLPNEDKTTQNVMNVLNGAQLEEWIAQADTLTPKLYLPKFKMEFKMNLKEPLTDMGMELPFTEEAEFSEFFNEDVGEKLFIDRVMHQSFIEVNEEGTEAAAATAVGIGLVSIDLDKLIRIDRPFVFLIRENHTGAVLFAGKMMHPEM